MMIKNWREFYLSENNYDGYHPNAVKLLMMDDAQTQHPNAEADVILREILDTLIKADTDLR